MINHKHKLTFIHVGKCGGSTIMEALRDNDINFNHIHLEPAKYNSDKKYLISLRNPVERFVSAFYWRKHLVLGKQKDRFAGEYDFFQKYATIENVIQEDINLLQTQYIHHVKECIHYYLADFVDQCNSSNIRGIVCTENLSEDIKNIFNIKVEAHCKNNKKRKTKIKQETRECLKKYFYKDYLIVEKLNNLKLLTKKQYEILSK